MESLLQNFVSFFTFTHVPLEAYRKSATRNPYVGSGTRDPPSGERHLGPGTRDPGHVRGTQDLGPSNWDPLPGTWDPLCGNLDPLPLN